VITDQAGNEEQDISSHGGLLKPNRACEKTTIEANANTFRVRPRSVQPSLNWLKSFSRSPNRFQLPVPARERSIPLPLDQARTTMSFAGRRRGNKVKKGVQFTVMVVGQSFFVHISFLASSTSFYLALLGASGTGRTTFVNTLCESEVLSHKISDSPETAHVEEGIRIKPANVGALQPLCHQIQFFSGLTCYPFRVGGGWRAHRSDNCGHPRFW